MKKAIYILTSVFLTAILISWNWTPTQHPKVEKVYFLGNITEKDGDKFRIKQKQCMTDGGMISFDIKGKEKEAFKEPLYLNRNKRIPIRSVRMYTGLSAVEPVKWDKK